MKASPAYNNVEKMNSRVLVAKYINEFIEEPVTMIEFLGNGTGALYYAENIKKLNYISAIERDKEAFDMFINVQHNHQYLIDKKILTWNTTIEKYIKSTWGKFNVINLDFCTFYYDNNSHRSPLRTIEKVFASNILSDTSLVIFTFMTQGRNILLHEKYMEITKDLDSIRDKLILKIEESNKYKVSEHLLTNEYESCGRGLKTRMANVFFTINKV